MFSFNRKESYEKITVSLSFYEDGYFLKNQLCEFLRYPNNIDIQIIDDCSLKDPIENYLKMIPSKYSIYKIHDDIKWNIPGVRNLACMVASNPWIIHLDMDQIMPTETIKKLNSLKLNKNNFYVFNRKLKNYNKYSTGTILMHRNTFWKCGGYDEDFSGIYGHNDPFLKEKLKLIGVKEKKLNDYWLKDFSEDASCSLPKINSEKNLLLMKLKLKNKQLFSKNIRFNWSRIQ